MKSHAQQSVIKGGKELLDTIRGYDKVLSQLMSVAGPTCKKAMDEMPSEDDLQRKVKAAEAWHTSMLQVIALSASKMAK